MTDDLAAAIQSRVAAAHDDIQAGLYGANWDFVVAQCDLADAILALCDTHSFGVARPEWKTRDHNGAHDVVRVDALREALATAWGVEP